MQPGIYIHLPFCVVHCSYCDFPLSTRLSLSSLYYEALEREVQMRPPQQSNTLYFGGGTPSVTPAAIINKLIKMVPLTQDSEITLEANPDDVSAASLSSWLECGITRLSIGVQSLEADVLALMLRRHSPQQAIIALQNAQQSGFKNINVDLMLGSPCQTPEGFLLGLTQILDFQPQHLSLYLLEVHEGTLLARQIQEGKAQQMPEDEQVSCYLQAVNSLKKAGYLHYEVSNFALPGFESRHNLKYWTSAPYYGYGVGACSYYEQRRIQNLRDIPAYVQAITSGQLPIESDITENRETEARNAVIFGLRKTDGIDVESFKITYGIHPLSLFENKADLFLAEGYLELHNGRLRLTSGGLLLSNEILSSAI
ncbi:MAG TPA: radical SAM family heme chaperone HemW [Acidobacteriota bacterium]